MLRYGTNPYLIARQFAGLNRVQAAMMLPSSETSLKEYESGQKKKKPPDKRTAQNKTYMNYILKNKEMQAI